MNEQPQKERPIDVVGVAFGLIVAIAFFVAMGYGLYEMFIKTQ